MKKLIYAFLAVLLVAGCNEGFDEELKPDNCPHENSEGHDGVATRVFLPWQCTKCNGAGINAHAAGFSWVKLTTLNGLTVSSTFIPMRTTISAVYCASLSPYPNGTMVMADAGWGNWHYYSMADAIMMRGQVCGNRVDNIGPVDFQNPYYEARVLFSIGPMLSNGSAIFF